MSDEKKGTWNVVTQLAVMEKLAKERTDSPDHPKGYITNDDVHQLAERPDFLDEGKTVSMIRGKAVSLGIYKKEATKRAVGGASSTRKMEYVRATETLLGLQKDSLLSFEKASKPQLELVTNALIKLSDQQDADLKTVTTIGRATKAESTQEIEMFLGMEPGSLRTFGNAAGKADLDKLRSHLSNEETLQR